MFAQMTFIRDILLGAEKRNGNLIEMCKALDINPSDLYRSEIKVSFETAYRAWEVALKQTGDPLLGLHLGEQTNTSILGLVGHLMQSCPTLEEAFKAVCSFSGVASDLFSYSLSRNGDKDWLTYTPCTPWVKVAPISARQGVEQAMAGTLNVFMMLIGKKIVPERVMLRYPKPKDPSEYERIFQAPVTWNAPSNTLVFSHRQLLSPVLSYDESMMGLFCDLIKKRFSELNKETFENKVKREIMTTFMGQLPSIETMAARFNTTVRSFQRQLEEEQLSYRQVCSSLGKDFSVSLLSNEKIKVAEVAAALGYSDTRAFQRAFKSWTGQSPGKFRETLVSNSNASS